MTVLNSDYLKYEALAIIYLEKIGVRIELGEKEGKPVILEKSGVIATAAAMQEIDQGKVKPGENVLVAVTGGCRASRKK